MYLLNRTLTENELMIINLADPFFTAAIDKGIAPNYILVRTYKLINIDEMLTFIAPWMLLLVPEM